VTTQNNQGLYDPSEGLTTSCGFCYRSRSVQNRQ